jgi:succinate-semialdehyde dehydrogenase/glutarate-semialdehyde dehydrogenase
VWSNEAAEQDWIIRCLIRSCRSAGSREGAGYGRELAAACIREFCNLKTVWKA